MGGNFSLSESPRTDSLLLLAVFILKNKNTIYRTWTVEKNMFHFTSTFDIRQWYKCNFQVSPCWFFQMIWLDRSHSSRLFLYSDWKRAPTGSAQSDHLLFIEIWCNQSSRLFLLRLMLRIWAIGPHCLWGVAKGFLSSFIGDKGSVPSGGRVTLLDWNVAVMNICCQVNSVESCHTNTKAAGTSGECLIGDKESGSGFSGCFL